PASGEPADASRERPGSDRARSYLSSLPDGLASHPECRVDAALVRLALMRAPLEDDIVVAVRRDHGLLTERWIPEVCGRAVLAAIADAHGFSREEYEAFVRRTVRA